jgi:two-component system cell cycle sensor histidine kinase/response regulator CckA
MSLRMPLIVGTREPTADCGRNPHRPPVVAIEALLASPLYPVMLQLTYESILVGASTMIASAAVVGAATYGRLRSLARTLRETEERYRALFEQHPLPMFVWDAESKHFIAANNAALEHYGYTREELLEMSVWDIRPQEAIPQVQRLIERLPPGRHVFPGLRHRKKDGTIIVVDVMAHDLTWDGRPARLVLANDVTERERAQEELRTSEEHLRQAQKMEAVGRLAGGIAHDFNNALAVIKSFSHFLIEDLDPDDRRRSDVREIAKAADRAAAMTRKLLAFGRKQVLQPKALDLNTVVASMGPTLRRMLGPSDITVKMDLDPTARVIEADPGQIEQVILNLAANARDAMPRGGTLTIHTRNEVLERAAAKWEVRPGSYTLISVSDTGIGMDETTKAHLFEPYFTTKEQGKGSSGLGLSTVYGIIKQSGGHVWVDSAPGQGTTFRIYMPHATSRDSLPTVSPRPHVAAAGQETILLVDDEEALRVAARRMLQGAGFTVLQASDGADALRVLAEHTGPVHALVTDVVMPRVGGPELVRRLREVRPDLPALFISGYTEEGVRTQGVLQPDAAYLEKPFSQDDLVRKVRELLAKPAGAPPGGYNVPGSTIPSRN